MDWLLRFLLKTFIRRGTFQLTTSRGTQIVFGDGTGKPVAVATRAAEWGVLLDPELRLGDAYTSARPSHSLSPSISIRATDGSRTVRWRLERLRIV